MYKKGPRRVTPEGCWKTLGGVKDKETGGNLGNFCFLGGWKKKFLKPPKAWEKKAGGNLLKGEEVERGSI